MLRKHNNTLRMKKIFSDNGHKPLRSFAVTILMVMCIVVNGTSQIIDSIHQELQNASLSKKDKAQYYNELAWQYQHLNLDSTRFYGNKALAMVSNGQWPEVLSNAYNRLGNYYFYRSEYDSALFYHKKSYRVRRDARLEKPSAGAAYNVATTNIRVHLYDKALEYADTAYTLYQKLGDSIGMELILFQMAYAEVGKGDFGAAFKRINQIERLGGQQQEWKLAALKAKIYSRQYRVEEASKWINRALKVFEGGKKSLRKVYSLKANICLQQNKLDSSEYYYQQEWELHNHTAKNQSVFKLHTNVALVQLLNGDLQKCKHSLNKARRILAKSPEHASDNLFWRTLGGYHKSIGDLDSAVYCYKKGLALANDIKSLNNVELLFNLYNVYVEQKEYKKANDIISIYHELNDSLYDVIQSYQQNEQTAMAQEFEADLALRETINEMNETKFRNTKLVLVIVALLLVILSLLLYMRFQKEKNKRKLADKKKELLNNRIESLLQTQELKSIANVLEVQEQERRRIAQDLHDKLGGTLSIVKLQFTDIQNSIGVLQEQTRQTYKHALTALDSASDEVRKVAHNLISGSLTNFGLDVALQELSDSIQRSESIDFEYINSGFDERLDTNQESHIYRIVQEMVSNTLKHAEAKSITLQIIKRNDALSIVYEDDGIGFNPDEITSGMGLKSIESRVEKLNGTFEIDSGNGVGTTYNITIDTKDQKSEKSYHS